MPWSVSENSGECPDSKPYAVTQDDTGEVVGCHATEEDAQAQVEALYANEPNAGWRVEETEAGWVVLGTDGPVGEPHATYQSAVGAVGRLAVGDHAGANLSDTRWRSDVAFQAATGDGRDFSQCQYSARSGPLPLMLQTSTEMGHFGAQLAGWFDGEDVRTTNGTVTVAGGHFDNSEVGRQALEIIESRGRFGVSFDGASADVDVVCVEEDPELGCIATNDIFHSLEIMGLTMTPFPAFADAYVELQSSNGTAAVSDRQRLSLSADGQLTFTNNTFGPDANTSASGYGVTVTNGVIRGSTGAIPAIRAAVQDVVHDADAILSAATPDKPPADWFENPGFDGPTPVTIGDDGRIRGHAALWGTCHISRTDVCLTPPPSRAAYQHFQTGCVRTAEGNDRATGLVTMNIGHALLTAGHRDAAAHYDHTGTQAADVAVGEDAWGIWVAGAVRPDLDDVNLRRLRASALSGDWRSIGGSLELVGLLAVNVPGFPVPRTQARVASGHQMALVAAGIPPLAREEHDERVRLLERQMADANLALRALAPLAREQLQARIAQHRN